MTSLLAGASCSGPSGTPVALAGIGPSQCVDVQSAEQFGVAVGEFPALDLTVTSLKVIGENLRVRWDFAGPVVILDGTPLAADVTYPSLFVGVALRTEGRGTITIVASTDVLDPKPQLTANYGRVVASSSTSVEVEVPLRKLRAVEPGLTWDSHVEYDATAASGDVHWWDDCSEAPYATG